LSNSSANNQTSAVNYLLNFFQTQKWKDLGDTFRIASVLQVLGEIEKVPLQIIQNGIESLYERANFDGGWGGAKGEPSNNEYTAVSMIALYLAGENKFVPARLVNAAFDLAEDKISKLQNEINDSYGSVDQRIKTNISNIIKEKNELQEKVNTLTQEKKSLQVTVQSYQDQLNELSVKDRELNILIESFKTADKSGGIWYSRPEVIIGLMGAFFALFTLLSYSYSSGLSAFYQYLISIVKSYGLSYSAILVSISFVISFIISQRKSSREQDQMLYKPQKEFIVQGLLNLTAGWALSKREDFIFQLARSETIPSEDRDSYIAGLSTKYGEGLMEQNRLRDIIFQFEILPPSVRMLILDEVRNTVSTYAKK
jgi:hypothetical protein